MVNARYKIVLRYQLSDVINTLNSMFHTPMGRFQFELIYYFTCFSTIVPSNSCMFLSCRPFVFNTFSTSLVCLEVSSASWLGYWQLEFKSQVIVIVCFLNFVCYLVWAVDLGVQITEDQQPRPSNIQNFENEQFQ